MALTGMDIYKLLPKKNCKECGFPTCLAFAMKLAQGGVEAEKCPYMSEDAKTRLSEATAPPMRTVRFGAGDRCYTLGGETVLFRHEKTFVNRPRFAVAFSDTMSNEEIQSKIERMNKVDYIRISEEMYVEIAALECKSGNKDTFLSLIKRVKDGCKKAVPMIITSDPEIARAAVEECRESGPILFGADEQNYEAMVNLAKQYNLLLGVTALDQEKLYDLVQKIQNLGYRELLLSTGSTALKQVFDDVVNIRRTALVSQDRTFGYPTAVFAHKLAKEKMMQLAIATLFVEKYASVIVLDDIDYSLALPLFALRQNIYTDPQRPMRVEQGLYRIGSADENSPLLVTVDFALTYFIVSGEVERSKVPAWMLIPDAGGYSVLTAWAAGKFSGKTIARAVKEFAVEEKLKTREIIIPGKVAVLKADIEDELPSWKVVVGAEEAALLPKFLRDYTGKKVS
ncbi:acetyl-CoA decarbonylase/synthase complex subunit gamma [Thermosediminibacter litoriperuensis]|uniref:CO-methylating acetyl-CoA synthase corrinoid iron-sulfur protein large subunit n=1 Tax=Thermosediminibacter litoriperuensis TaxID=291989 RepID=A0A5S5AW03_9FIRM|nr:acetyl-CoA decarbonylase/synthase complex subunit gamma [Thermosediminibacter litoriperuensis]TYP56655.1 CO-methylating acetyl-CoA synthase corrinoid iron-sulfur protein large subunit precursor [Thermosediminibacter litoriperuensis]